MNSLQIFQTVSESKFQFREKFSSFYSSQSTFFSLQNYIPIRKTFKFSQPLCPLPIVQKILRYVRKNRAHSNSCGKFRHINGTFPQPPSNVPISRENYLYGTRSRKKKNAHLALKPYAGTQMSVIFRWMTKHCSVLALTCTSALPTLPASIRAIHIPPVYRGVRFRINLR